MSDGPTLGEVIRRFLPQLLADESGVTRGRRAMLVRLGQCGTDALGGHVYRCDRCGSERIAYNRCRSRHCPSCLAHKRAAWLQARAGELLPVPYFHVVFTVPKELGALALGNKSAMYGMLMRASGETLVQLARDPRRLGAELGVLAVLHTWTQTLLHHPHVHCVVPGGGLSADGARWVHGRARYLFPVRVMAALFRGKLLAWLDAAYRRGELQLAGGTSALADPKRWQAWLRALRRKRWVVYAKPPFGSPLHVLKYLAAYTHRVAFSNRRILAFDATHMTFSYRDRTHGDVSRSMRLPGTEFLRRFTLHLLPKGFVRVRYFGFLANRVREERLERCRALLGAPNLDLDAEAHVDGPSEPAVTRSEHDTCPSCGLGHLVLVSVVPRSAPPATSTVPRPPDTS